MKSDDCGSAFGNHGDNEWKLLLSTGPGTPSINGHLFTMAGFSKATSPDTREAGITAPSPPQTKHLGHFWAPRNAFHMGEASQRSEELNKRDLQSSFPSVRDTVVAACSFTATWNRAAVTEDAGPPSCLTGGHVGYCAGGHPSFGGSLLGCAASASHFYGSIKCRWSL